jgi:formylmethanofuran:tetrahydromethanopterin formyltransferase
VSPGSSISSRTSVQANPRDMNSIAGHGSDHRTLEKLFNNRNNSMDDRNMWLIPFNKGEDHTIMIDLGETRTISGLKFYNYNKSVEDTLRGARNVIIKIDD